MQTTITMKGWNIGPAHDPYGADQITIKTDIGYTVEYYSDGLGQCRVTVYMDGGVYKERRWHRDWPATQANKNNDLYANLLCKRFTGITIDEANDQYNRDYVEDPYGPASRYE